MVEGRSWRPARFRAGTGALLVLAAACSQPPQRAPAPPSAAPFSSQALLPPRPCLPPGTSLRIRQVRSIEGLPREESSARITWEQIAATGLPSAGVLVLERSVQIRSDEVLHSPQEGLQLRVEERSGALRLLRGSAPSLLDVTAEHPALAALLGPASGRSPLLPSRPLRAGESWTIPLGRYLDATSLPAARTLGGTVRARLLGFDEHRARLTFEVDLSTSGSAGTRTAIHFNGRALLDRDLGLVLERRLQGRIERGASRRSLEVSIDIEVLPRAR